MRLAVKRPSLPPKSMTRIAPIRPRTRIPTATEYDDLGRRIATHEGIKQAYPTDASSIDRTYEQTTNYEYDKAGNLTAVILPAVPHPTLLDAQNHPLMVRPRYEYAYDQYGNRIQIRDNVFQVGSNIFYSNAIGANPVDQAVFYRTDGSPKPLYEITANTEKLDRYSRHHLHV